MATRYRTMSDEEIIELYQKGLPVKEISNIVGISTRSISSIVKKNNFDRRSVGKPRQYKVNEDFFKTWSNDMAWVLGMIITDGYVVYLPSDHNYVFSIVQKDISKLDKIKKILESNHPYTKPSKTRTPGLTIGSKKMVEDLMSLGIHPRKSLTVEFPKVPKEFMSHFIRGVIDGDGWVQDRGYVMNVTSASIDFANGLMNVFQKWGLNTDITSEDPKTGNLTYRIWVRGKEDVSKLAAIIYKDCKDLYYEYKRYRMEQHKRTQLSFHFRR